MNGFYQNSGPVNKRNRKQILILDVSDKDGETFLGAGTEFSVDLFEPLIIDSLSEVYLDNFITYNSNISNQPDNSAFALKINEFNMNSNVASASSASLTRGNIFNSLLIPNEHSNVSNNQSMVIQKAKKFNYICDINPGKIGRITGTITNLAGGPMFHGSSTTAIYTYALTGIDSGNLDIKVLNKTAFTNISNMGGGSSASGTFLATHFSTATTLHFASKQEITGITSTTTNIVFTIVGGNLILTNTGTNNPNLTLITNPGRFIAELSINSRE